MATAAPAKIGAANVGAPGVGAATVGDTTPRRTVTPQENFAKAPARPIVLIATADQKIAKEIGDILERYWVKTVCAKTVEEVRNALRRETVSICFCGFWLLDGTYRDVIRHLKGQPSEIPAVVVCAPECPSEYKDYLAALKIRAFNFISHPYNSSEIEQIFPFSQLAPVL